MSRPSDSALAEASVWQLAWAPAPPRGSAGDVLARGTGSSIEFQDRRLYAPGDDVRHLDWRAFARTGELAVKLYREELLPRLELCFDASASMAVDEDKAQLTVDLLVLLARAAEARGFEVRLIEVADEPRRVSLDELHGRGVQLTGRLPLHQAWTRAALLLRPGTLRLFVSDFLSPLEPAGLVRGLAARAGGLALLQVLARDDAAPEVGGALRMTDAETNEAREVVLEAAVVEGYLERLERWSDALETECRRAGARFVRLVAGAPLADLARGPLTRAGLLEPR